MSGIRRLFLIFLTFLVLSMPVASLHAAGIGKPLQNGARAVGMGGAFVAVADDSTSIYYNPAGLVALRDAEILASLELLMILRSQTPLDENGDYASKMTASKTPLPLPTFTGGARFPVGSGGHLALGFGGYLSYGGGVRYDQRPITEGTVFSRMGLYEFAPTVAYELDRRVYIGGSLRFGLGFLRLRKGCGDLLACSGGREAIEFTNLDTIFGVGFGYSLGIRVEPVDGFYIGASYQSSLDVTVEGSDSLHSSGNAYDASMKMPFPASVSLGVAYRVIPRLLLAAQYSWVGYSRFEKLRLDVPDLSSLPNDMVETPCDWNDSHKVHLGAEFAALSWLLVRAGWVVDTPAIPKKNRIRELDDGYKMSFALGGGVRLGRWRMDLALDYTFGDFTDGFDDVVYDDSAQAPGIHHPGGSVSIHMGAAVTF